MQAENIARALSSVAAALELATPDQVNPDYAVQLLEQMASDLAAASESELVELEVASLELASEAEAAGPGYHAAVTFYSSFPRGFFGS